LKLANTQSDVHQIIGIRVRYHTGHKQTPPVDLKTLNFTHRLCHHSGAVIDQLVEFEELRNDIIVPPVWKLDLVPPKSYPVWVIGLSIDELPSTVMAK